MSLWLSDGVILILLITICRYDGNETIGHRLYKEVYFFEKGRGKSTGTVPAVSCQWETLATNLEEFNKIVVRMHVLLPKVLTAALLLFSSSLYCRLNSQLVN